MTFTIHIPHWLLWVVGVPLTVAVLFFAWLGWGFARAWNGSNI